MVVLPVLEGDDPVRPHLQAGLLPDFFYDIFSHRDVHVHPASGQSPPFGLPHQQDALPLKDGGPGGQLGGLVARLIAEPPLDLLQGQVRLPGHHLRGDLPDAGVPLPVKLVLSIVQPRLGQALELTGPLQPRFSLFHVPPISIPNF